MESQRTAGTSYREDPVSPGNPQQRSSALFERLDRACKQGFGAVVANDTATAHEELSIAEATVCELHASLQAEGTPDLPELLSLCAYLRRRLLQAADDASVGAAKEAVLVARYLARTWARTRLLRAGGAR